MEGVGTIPQMVLNHRMSLCLPLVGPCRCGSRSSLSRTFMRKVAFATVCDLTSLFLYCHCHLSALFLLHFLNPSAHYSSPAHSFILAGFESPFFSSASPCASGSGSRSKHHGISHRFRGPCGCRTRCIQRHLPGQVHLALRPSQLRGMEQDRGPVYSMQAQLRQGKLARLHNSSPKV